MGVEVLVMLGFYVQQTSKVIWRWENIWACKHGVYFYGA